MNKTHDVIIIGVGAAGLMCAIEAGKRGRSVLLLDHSKKVAEKIRISGGGRCNFTNIHTSPTNFLSQNKHFCKSALSGYTPQDFIALVEKHGIQYHEKTLGQQFCDDSAQNIIDMLLRECDDANVKISMQTIIDKVSYADDCYTVGTSKGRFISQSLVIATGGLSIPKIGATPFGYQIAEKFGLNIIKPRAGLVPLTFDVDITQRCRNLTGISVNASVRANKTQFTEGMLFTHRGLSGPSILQISSYWNEGDTIQINMALDHDVLDFLKTKKQQSPKQDIQKILAEILPKRICESILEEHEISGRIADLSGKKLDVLANHINNWTIKPCGTEGYRTAEVTLGGVNTNELSSKTFEAKKQENLFFIGEVIDVTGHLGGFNFQWAWASGFAAGQYA